MTANRLRREPYQFCCSLMSLTSPECPLTLGIVRPVGAGKRATDVIQLDAAQGWLADFQVLRRLLNVDRQMREGAEPRELGPVVLRAAQFLRDDGDDRSKVAWA